MEPDIPLSTSNEPCPRCTPSSMAIWSSNQLETWLACDGCDTWFHAACVGLQAQECAQIHHYYCPECTPLFGDSTMKESVRKSQRNVPRVEDYNVLENSDLLVPRDRIDALAAFPFAKHTIERRPGTEATTAWARSCQLDQPALFDGPVPGMRMPAANITVPEIADLVGRDRIVDVMDVNSQRAVPGWTMDSWAAYFSASGNRSRTLNVISLEVSDTALAEQVRRPQLVEELDWVTRTWPEERKAQGEYPQIQLYCLMSVRECYTDFHVDFGGSSVFYHILSGSKIFYFIPPTAVNLRKYEKWCNSPEQATTLLAELAHPCYRVELRAGDTMIIPTGWIHAVYTPEDAIVIGGNFLHGLHMSRQLDVYDIERRTAVPQQFCLPYFEQICWYTALDYLRRLQDAQQPDAVSEVERAGLDRLAAFLDATLVEQRQGTIPPELEGIAGQRLRELRQQLRTLQPSAASAKNPFKVRIRLGGPRATSSGNTAVSTPEQGSSPARQDTDDGSDNSTATTKSNKLRIRISGTHIKAAATVAAAAQPTRPDRSRHDIFDDGHHPGDTIDPWIVPTDDPQDDDFDPHYQSDDADEMVTRKRPHDAVYVAAHSVKPHDPHYDLFDGLGLSDARPRGRRLRTNTGAAAAGSSSRSSAAASATKRGNGRGGGSVVSKILRDMRRR